jgi:hypothetical protein
VKAMPTMRGRSCSAPDPSCAYAGQTAWKDIARQPVKARGYAESLLFVAEIIGSYGRRHVQADVVAINWTVRAILSGE